MPSQREDESESELQYYKELLQSFLNHFERDIDTNAKTIMKNAMEINISLVKEQFRRVTEKNNVTICNGDSHINNFMIPIGMDKKPLMVDFQFWSEGLGVGDLAHLTRLNFSDEFKEEFQKPLVEQYYKTLLSHGVINYSWESCFRDYRICVATMVLIPFFQYSFFGANYDDWIDDLKGLIYNYELLQCDELKSLSTNRENA